MPPIKEQKKPENNFTMLKALFKLLLLLGFVVYLVFALTRWNKEDESRLCHKMTVETLDEDDGIGDTPPLVSEAEVKELVRRAGLWPEGKRMDCVDPVRMEEAIRRHPYIDSVVCFKTAGDQVRVSLWQSRPLLRVMGEGRFDGLLDRRGRLLPRMGYAVDLPVATGAITPKHVRETLLPAAKAIEQDPFWREQTEQLCVENDGTLEIVPRVGGHILRIGEAKDVEQKLSRAKEFYTKVLDKVGWRKYRLVSVEYDNQIICKKR